MPVHAVRLAEMPVRQGDTMSMCLHEALEPQEREDIAEAAERVMERAAKSGDFVTIEAYVELILEEAEAIERRREMAVVKTCPHCGEALP